MAAPARMSPAGCLERLGKALTGRGFTVALDEERLTVTALNVAAAPDDPDDPLAVAYGSTSLSQRVRLGHNDGEPFWFWEWSGPERGSAPEYEPIAPAVEIELVATRVARVLALAGR